MLKFDPKVHSKANKLGAGFKLRKLSKNFCQKNSSELCNYNYLTTIKDYEDHRETRVERMAFENFLRFLSAGRANSFEVKKPRRAKYFTKSRYPAAAATDNQVDYVKLLYLIDQTLQKLSHNYGGKGVDYTKKKPKKNKPIKYKSPYKSAGKTKPYKPSKAEAKENFYKQESYLKEKAYTETTPVEPYKAYKVKPSKKSKIEKKPYELNERVDEYPQTTKAKPYEDIIIPPKEKYLLETTTKSYESIEYQKKSEGENKPYKSNETSIMLPKEHYPQTTTSPKPYELTEIYVQPSKTTSMPLKEYYPQTTTAHNVYNASYKPSKPEKDIITYKPSEIAFMPPITTTKPYESTSTQEVYSLSKSENDKKAYKPNEIKSLKDYYLPITTTRPYEIETKSYKPSEIAFMPPVEHYVPTTTTKAKTYINITTTPYLKAEEESELDLYTTEITDPYEPDLDESHAHEETDEYMNQFKKKYFRPTYSMKPVGKFKPLVAIDLSSYNSQELKDEEEADNVYEEPIVTVTNNITVKRNESAEYAYSSLYNKTQVEIEKENTAAIELFNRTFHPSHYKPVVTEVERAKSPNHTASKLTSLRAVNKKHAGERREHKLDKLFEKKVAQQEPIDSKDIYYMNLFIKLFKYINSTLEA